MSKTSPRAQEPKSPRAQEPKSPAKLRAAALLLLVLLITACPLATAVASVLNPEYAAGYDPETKIYRFQPGDLTVTAYYDDGTSRILSYDEYELEKPYVQNTGDLSQTVTVNYTENNITASDKFTVDVNLPIGKRGSVVLDCNGGMIVPDDNWAIAGQTGAVSTLSKSMIPYGSEITLPTTKPTFTSHEFVSWINTATGQTYNPGELIEIDTTDIITLTAKWEPYNVKYAVRLYGINEDTGLNGETLGLTFGPSGGYDGQKGIYNQPLIDTYVCHDDNDPMCLHNMTWEQIIEQSQADPTVFQTCLENGCTHSVCLIISKPITDATITDATIKGKMDNGDGASTLYYSLFHTYRRYNPPTNYKTIRWQDSMIRNTFNGVPTTNSGTSSAYKALDETNCLLTAFPSVLQENIAAKKVISGTSSDRNSELTTTYDKLWSFSSTEMYAPGGYNYDTAHFDSREGKPYQSQILLNAIGTTTDNSSQAINRFYNEYGGESSTWSRSIYNDTFIVYFQHTGHPLDYRSDFPYVGFSPGFCLP